MTMVVVIGDSEAFDCRRDLAAWVGTLPPLYSMPVERLPGVSLKAAGGI